MHGDDWLTNLLPCRQHMVCWAMAEHYLDWKRGAYRRGFVVVLSQPSVLIGIVFRVMIVLYADRMIWQYYAYRILHTCN